MSALTLYGFQYMKPLSDGVREREDPTIRPLSVETPIRPKETLHYCILETGDFRGVDPIPPLVL